MCSGKISDIMQRPLLLLDKHDKTQNSLFFILIAHFPKSWSKFRKSNLSVDRTCTKPKHKLRLQFLYGNVSDRIRLHSQFIEKFQHC